MHHIFFDTSSRSPAVNRVCVDQRWHYTFTKECFSPVLEAVATPSPPAYSDILALDARIRNFEVPPFMQVTPGTGSGNTLCLLQIWTHMTREVGA